MNRDAKIWITDHTDMTGAAILRALKKAGYQNLLCYSPDELDLQDQQAVLNFYLEQHPEYVFHNAARSGGILSHHTYGGQFLYENLQMLLNVLHGGYLARVKKLLFLSSAAVYPRNAHPPVREDQLFTGPLEPAHEPYGIAQIAGIKMGQAYRRQYDCNFISIVPANLYGPQDHFDLASAHVLPALLRKFHEALIHDLPAVSVWGTGMPRREFLHVDDLAEACLFLMLNYDQPEIVNVGSGQDLSINELAHLVRAAVGYRGMIEFDASKPDGAPRVLLDARKLHDLGWRSQIALPDGIRKTYEWFLQNVAR